MKIYFTLAIAQDVYDKIMMFPIDTMTLSTGIDISGVESVIIGIKAVPLECERFHSIKPIYKLKDKCFVFGVFVDYEKVNKVENDLALKSLIISSVRSRINDLLAEMIKPRKSIIELIENLMHEFSKDVESFLFESR